MTNFLITEKMLFNQITFLYHFLHLCTIKSPASNELKQTTLNLKTATNALKSKLASLNIC